MRIVQTIDPVIINHAELIVHQQFPGSLRLLIRTRTQQTVQTVPGHCDAARIHRIDFLPGVAFDSEEPARGLRAVSGGEKNLSVKRDAVAQTFKLHSLCSSDRY